MADNLFLSSDDDNSNVINQGVSDISRLSLPGFPGAPASNTQTPDTSATPNTGSRAAPTKEDVAKRAQELGIDPKFALSIFGLESGSNFKSKDSSVGAVGGMQVMPDTYKMVMGTYAGQRDPWNNMEAGLRYIAYGQKKLGTTDPALLAAGYQSGYDRKSLQQGIIPNTTDGGMTTKQYAATIASRVGISSPGTSNSNATTLQATLDQQEPGRYKVLDPDEAQRLQAQQSLDAQEPGRYKVLTPDQLAKMPASSLPTAASTTPATPPGSPSFLDNVGDIAKNLKVGFNMAAQDTRELASRVLPKRVIGAIDSVDTYLHGQPSDQFLKQNTQNVVQSMTPQMQAALGKDFVTTDDKGSMHLGPAWTDWRSYAGGVVQSLPEQAMMMAPGLALARGAYVANVGRIGVQQASELAARTAMVSGMLTEGALGGAQSSRQVRDDIMAMPQETLNSSDAYNSLKSQGMSDDQARAALANDSATRAFVTSGVATGIFGGMGDRAVAKVFTEGVSKSAMRRALSGAGKSALAEGLFEEVPQSALQQMAQNEAEQKADKTIPLMKDVVNQGVQGGVLGAVQGGGMGAIAGARNINAHGVPPQAAPAPAEPIEPTFGPAPAAPQAAPAAPAPAPAAPGASAGPIGRALEKAADVSPTQEQPQADQQPGAVIMGDDGKQYRIKSGEDGVTVEPVEEDTSSEAQAEAGKPAPEAESSAPAAPKSKATPAPAAPQPSEATKAAAPSVPTPAAADRPLTDWSESELRDRLRYLTQQAKNNNGWSTLLSKERKKVSNEIDRRNEGGAAPAAPVTAGPIEEPAKAAPAQQEEQAPRTDSGAYVDQSDANHAAIQMADKTGQVHLVTPREEGGKTVYDVKPREAENASGVPADSGADNGRDSVRNSGAAPSDQPAQSSVASADSAARAGEGTAAQTPTLNDATARAKEQFDAAMKQAEQSTKFEQAQQRDEYAGKWFGSREKAQAFVDKKKAGDTHEIVQTGKVRFEIKPKAAESAKSGTTEGMERFAPETGTLGIPRAEMPQVPTQSHGALVNHLNAQGIGHETKMVDPNTLKPTQAEFSPEKVEQAKEATGDRAVIVSNDGHIIDGHHQVLAAQEEGKDVKAIVLDAPVAPALTAVANSPSAERAAEAEAPRAEAANETPAEPTPPNGGKDRFAGNKIFTSDAVEKARARLKSKLNGSQLNSGIDPELVMDGMTIAGAYIESGVRDFATYAKAMTEDLGDAVKPYLLSFYEAARAYPGLDTKGMTPADEARAQHAALLTPEVKAAAAEAIGEPVEKPAKRTRKTGGSADKTLTQDWGVDHIDGYGDDQREEGNSTKDAFLKESRDYLRAVTQQLAEKGYSPLPDAKGRPRKAVSVNEAGPAVSGDVTLSLHNPEIGGGIYAQISGTSLRGVVPHTPSGISIMFRGATEADPYGTKSTNRWAPTDLSASDLAAMLDKEARSIAKQSPSSKMQSKEVTENDRNATEANTAESGADERAGRVQADAGARNADAVAEPAGRDDAGRDQRGAAERGSKSDVDEQSDVRGASAGENAGDQLGAEERRGSGAVAGNGHDQVPVSRVGTDYRIQPGELTRAGSWRATAEQNVRIIELVKQLEKEGRRPTPEEASLLTKFNGWGASEIANGVFPDRYGRYKDANWQALGERLKAALTPEEYDQAKRTTQYAHYTTEGVIRSIYDALHRMGFAGGKVLEPGMGIGRFKGLMPSSMAASSQYTGVEYDGLTGAIAKLLYPQSNIIVGDFTKTALPREFFDSAIGNPPFSSTVITNDPEYKKHGFMLHDYFFAKTLDRVKPGGLVTFITSKGTMDKASDRARKYLAERANLVGAIRLPQTAFKDNAGTEVVTDVLFLQKRGDGIPDNGVKWLGTAEVQTPQGPANINEYFAAHPEMVLGAHALTGSMYRANEYTVTPEPGVDMDQAFAKAVTNLPERIYQPGAKNPAASKAVALDRDFNPTNRKEGGLYVGDDGRLMQTESGSGIELNNRRGADGKTIALKPKDKAFLKSWVDLRNALKQAQLDQLSDGDWEKSLKALGTAYDAFVAKHGNLLAYSTITRTADDGTQTVTKRFKNDPLLRLDVDGALAYSLEHIQENGDIVKAPVLSERVLQQPREPEIKTTHDALFVSLNDKGTLDLDHVANLANMSRQEVIDALGSSIYEDPAKGWQTSDAYLSGNVVRKLAEAQAAARSDKKFARNVDALLAVQPKPLGPSEITVKLGQNWIPASDVAQFAKEALGESIDVDYNSRLGAWSAEQKGSNYSEFNTPKMSAGSILDSVLNNKQIKVTFRDSEGKTHVDAEATEKANDVAQKMRAAFQRWIWTDTKRADRLVNHYNDNFNNIAPRQFDGSHLTLPGVSMRFALRDNQKRAIWRGIQEGDMYLAHAVGAGKTYTMIANGMEERRLGLSNKPMFAVPNHMLAQFAREFLELYPAANIMVADEQNFHTHNRRRFVAQAALNNPDAIIITHSAFGRIGMSDEYASKFIGDQIDEWKQALDDTDKSDRITRKQIERRIEQLERRLEARQGTSKDKVLSFEELGVDRLFVDEFHEFRKLDFATNQGAIKGIDPAGSQRALDLFMKTQYLREKHPGRALVAASGTPITNTMGELYTAQRFFQPEQLAQDGLDSFDSWANQYGDIVAGFEQNAAGGYEVVSRFAKFQNVPELMHRVRSFMDILTSSQLSQYVDRPEVEGGGRAIKVTPEPFGYKAYQKSLEQRIQAIRDRKGPPKKGDDIILKVIADGRFSAIDMRFVDPTAPSDPNSKLNQMLDSVIKSYHETADNQYTTDGRVDPLKGSSHIIFTDIGLGEQSAANRGFDMKDWITKRLVDGGVQPDQIAFMRDNKEHAKKERLFADMREGKKRILIGGKDMETGVNVQKRLATLDHADAPWFPASVEQREGRIVRQGNQNPKVSVRAWATKGSYDSTMWGMNGRKARFIEQALQGDDSVRSLEDVSEASAFDMAAALASGDERYMRLAGLKADVDRLERLSFAHHDDQNKLRRDAHYAESAIERDTEYMGQLKDAIAKRKPIRAGEFAGTIGKSLYDNRDEFSTAVFNRFKELASKEADTAEQIGEIGGFPIMYHGTDLKGSGTYAADVTLDLPGDPPALLSLPLDPDLPVVGIATRAANQVNALDRQLADAQGRIAQNQRRVENIGHRLGAPFPEQAELLDKMSQLQQLEGELTAEKAAENAPAPSADAAVATLEAEGEKPAAVEPPKYSVGPEVDRNKVVPVTRITSFDAAPDDLWRTANEWYRANVTGMRVENESLGGSIDFSRAGRGKVLSVGRLDPRRMSIVKALPEIARNAVLVNMESDRKGREGLAGYARLVAPVDVDGKLYAVSMKVRREDRATNPRSIFYTIESFDLEGSSDGGGLPLPQSTQGAHSTAALQSERSAAASGKLGMAATPSSSENVGAGRASTTGETQDRPSTDSQPYEGFAAASAPVSQPGYTTALPRALTVGDLVDAMNESNRAFSVSASPTDSGVNRSDVIKSNSEEEGNEQNQESIKNALQSGPLGRVVSDLIAQNRVVLHDTVATLPVKKALPTVRGMTADDGTIHLVASNILDNPQSALFHEAIHEGAERLIGSAAWSDLMSQLRSLRRQAEQSGGRARGVLDAAMRRYAAADKQDAIRKGLEDEEFAAYLVEEQAKLPLAFSKWVDNLIGTVKAWLMRRFGKQFGDVTPAQIMAIAKMALQENAKRSTSVRTDNDPRLSVGKDTFPAEFMTELAAHDEVFSYPRSTSHTLEGVMKDVAPDVKFIGETTAPDERHESGADQKFLFRTAQGKDVKVFQTRSKVWLDVSDLDEGHGGNAIYSALFDYARNTRRVLIGDPAGLSDIALRRRTDNMLSSALKHGTTDHMEPHPRQLEGDKSLGVPPLKWSAGDHLANVQSMIDTTLQSLANYVPEFKNARFDFETGTFRDTKGKPISNEMLDRKISESEGVRASGAGRSTLKRGILLASLARSESSERPGLLERVLKQPDKLVQGAGRILYSVGGDGDNPVLTPPEPTRFERLQAAVQDNMNRVRKVQERIKKITGVQDLGYGDYYAAETNRPGRIASRLEDARKHLTEPLMKDLAKSGYKPEQLEELLHAQHAEERNKVVAEINPDMPDGGSGMKTSDANAILSKYHGDAKLHALAQQARDIARATLDLKLAYENIKQEEYDTYTKAYKNYVPLKGGGEYGPKIKRAMGHEEREEHILSNIARDYDQAVVTGEKNLARQSYLALVAKYPDDKLWTIGIPPRGRYIAGMVYNVVDMTKAGGETVGSFTSRSQVSAFLEGAGAAATNYQVLDSNGERVAEFVKPLQDNEVMVYVKGEPVRIQTKDETLARQIRPLDQAHMNPILEGMRTMNRYLSKIYTGYNPVFIFRNAYRDAMTGTINMVGNEGATTAAKAWTRYPAAVATLTKWAATGKEQGGTMGAYLKEYREQGGKTGASWMSDLETHGKTLSKMYEDAYGATGYLRDGRNLKAAQVAGRKIVGGMAHVVEIGNQATENALRLALFATLREQGAKPGIAAQAAKNVTVNFDRKGTMTGALGSIYLFFNPAVQGTANAIRTVAKGQHRMQAMTALGMLATLGAAAALKGMDDDKDRWLGRSWDSRTKNFVFSIGNHTLTIPVSQEFAPAYALGVAIAEAMRGEKPMTSAARMMSSFMDAYFPLNGAYNPDSDNHLADLALAVTPTLPKPVVQMSVNRNNFGSPIVPDNEAQKKLPDNMKMSRGTKGSVYDQLAQGIAQAGELAGAHPYDNDITKVSPETLKFLWQTYAGGLGQFVTDSIGVAHMGATDLGSVSSNDVPIVKNFWQQNDVKPIRSRFFDLYNEATDAQNEFEAAKKARDGQAIQDIFQRPGQSELIAANRVFTKMNKAVSAIRDQEQAVSTDISMSMADRTAKLKELEAIEEKLERGAIHAFDK